MFNLDKVALPNRSWINIASASWIHFVADFYTNLLPVLLPLLALKFGFSYSECGMLFMLFQVTASLLQAPIGILADRKNLGIYLPLSVLTGGVLASAVGLCDSAVILVAIIFLSGICSSGFHPISGGIIPLITPKGREVLSTSIYIVGGNIGFAIAPFVTALYLEHFTQVDLIYLAIIPILTTALAFKQRLYVKPAPLNPKDAISLKVILKCKPFLWLVSSIGLRAVCYCSLVIYIPLLFQSKGLSSISASAILMTMLIGTAIGGLLVGAIARRFKLKFLILSSYVLTILMMVLFLNKADDSLISYISIFIVGIGLYGVTPPAIVLAQRLLPKADSFATSMMLGFTFGLGYIISVLVGVIGDYTDLQSSLSLVIFPTMIGAVISILMVKES